MDLKELKKVFPHKWRVQSFSKKKAQAACVAYIDARQVMNLLDEVAGNNWQDKYVEHKGNLFCSIGIKIDDEWVWRTDCGSESNMEAEKGEASDAFKRAAVKWGIGRFLYSMKMEYLPANEKKEGNNYPYVVDNNGKKVWDLTEYINRLNPYPQEDNAETPLPTARQPIPKDVYEMKQQLFTIKEQLESQESEDFRNSLEIASWDMCRTIYKSIMVRLNLVDKEQ